MSRYFRASGWVEDETFSPEPAQQSQIVVPDHQAVDTGLLWSDGSTVWRAPNPIGFGRTEEWS